MPKIKIENNKNTFILILKLGDCFIDNLEFPLRNFTK
jgi:hypothetical protein